jgi:hypothetical protein
MNFDNKHQVIADSYLVENEVETSSEPEPEPPLQPTSPPLVSTSAVIESASMSRERNFSLNWEKVPENILNKIKAGKLDTQELRLFTNLVVDQARMVSEACGEKFLRQIAKSIAAKYPNCFLERNPEGQLISKYPVKLFAKLVNCNKYKIIMDAKKNESTKKKRRISKKVVNSVENISPNIDVLDEATMITQQLQLQSDDFLPEDSIRELMKNTYPLQRQYLADSCVKLSEIMEEWPKMFVRPYMDDHFLILTNRELTQLSRTYDGVVANLIKLLESANCTRIQTYLATKPRGNQYKHLVNLITQYFDENPDFLLRSFDVGTSKETILDEYIPKAYLENKKKKKTLGPIICEVGKLVKL